MVENPITPNQTPDQNKNQSTLNLGGFSLTPESIKTGITSAKTPTPSAPTNTQTPITLNLDNMASTGAKSENKTVGNSINLTNLNLSGLKIPQNGETDAEKEKTQGIFAGSSKSETKPQNRPNALSNVQAIITAYTIMFLAILGIIGLTTYKNYIEVQNQVQISEDDRQFIEQGKMIEVAISKATKINDYANWVDNNTLLISEDSKETAVGGIKTNKKLNYTQKKAVIQNNINMLNRRLIDETRTLENVKSEIEKYGFIPKELYDMTQKGEGIGSIRRGMVLRENVRFVTAFKVFGYMQSFLQGFASDSGIDPIDAEEKIKELNNNGEEDIITYTNNCYFNPYEVGDDCSITNDFDNYYTLVNKKSKIDPNFIKKIASYTERKLEEKNIPIYTITFPEFDPKQQNLTFTTEINTNRQDELALNKIGITNPHLYVLTNLINTLKQSLLVIGENIKIDQIKILPKTIRIGSTVFNVNTSTLNFDLPIQKTDQREITDFLNIEPIK